MIRVDFSKFRKGDYYCCLAPALAIVPFTLATWDFPSCLSSHRCWPSSSTVTRLSACRQGSSASADKLLERVVSIRQVFTLATNILSEGSTFRISELIPSKPSWDSWGGVNSSGQLTRPVFTRHRAGPTPPRTCWFQAAFLEPSLHREIFTLPIFKTRKLSLRKTR